jgi:hypothetical protein
MAFTTDLLFDPPLCTSSSILSIFQLCLYILLCTSLTVRYRHHIFSYCYPRRSAGTASTPRHAWEALIFLFLETYVLLLAAMRLLAAYKAHMDMGVNFSDPGSLAMMAYIALLEWVEQRQFGLYLVRFAERKVALDVSSESKEKAATDAPITPAQEQQPSSLLMRVLSKPITWFANRLPEPTAENVHVRYHFRAAAKAIICFALLVSVQPEACLVDASEWLDTTASFVPLMLTLAGFYVVRVALILRSAAKFTREELR